MVTIIKTLADEPLAKPEPPQFDEPEELTKEQILAAKNEMKTVELSKTIFRIGNLLQMSFGQLGAVIIAENVSSGDGSLEINIPGTKSSVILMYCRLNHFVKMSQGLQEHTCTFLNKVVNILHTCADRWDGSANKSDGDVYLMTWLLPNSDNSTDNEKAESQME
jgi:hypothetical protein